MRNLRIFLLVLIIIGLGLLVTEKLWVPKLVAHIIQGEADQFVPISVTGTRTPTPTPPAPAPEPAPVPRPGKVDTGVEGVTTIGPTCPVERNPPDPECADKPYPTTLVLATTIIGKNGGVLVQTDAKGYFSRELAPGTYTIRAQSSAMLPRLEPLTFTVVAGKLTSLNLQFDSGIR